MTDHAADPGLVPASDATKVTLGVLRVASLLADELDHELQESSGLGLSEVLVILQILFAGGRLRMAELADTLVVTRGGVTRIVDRLVDAGYLARVPSDSDRRVIYAQVTERAKQFIADAQPVFEAVTARRVGSLLTTPELAALHSAMHTLSCDNPGWQPPASVAVQHGHG
jgi:DNA-binding MarR family transcriptional regulator